MHTGFFLEADGRYHSGDLNIDGRILLKYFLKEDSVKIWIEFS
jgi:hypothetical protein